MPPGRRYDRVLVLSRSGTTTEILRLLARLSGVTPNVLITADPATPAASAADAVIGLDFADERSVVQTRFATTELALLLAHLGEDIAPMAAAADRVLAARACRPSCWPRGSSRSSAPAGRAAWPARRR